MLQAISSDLRGMGDMFEQAFASHAAELRTLRQLQHSRMSAVQHHFEQQLADMEAEFAKCVTALRTAALHAHHMLLPANHAGNATHTDCGLRQQICRL
jgi:hypothetical protein